MEVWKDIKGHNGEYQISNKGRVRSFKNGRWGLKKNPRTLSPFPNPQGYLWVDLTTGGYRSIHRLVAKTFLPNPKGKPCVNHKNGIKTDNRAANLEWCTHSENSMHATKNKLKDGEKHGNVKLTEPEVISIREDRENGMTQVALAKKYNISRRNIRSILNRDTWKHTKRMEVSYR